MTNTRQLRPAAPAALARGEFSDGIRTFGVRASSGDAPDSFQVHAVSDREDIVLIISGLNTGELKATWGPAWRAASEAWREWLEAQAFIVFYNGTRPAVGRVRVCNG